jgi:hypothetical protein
MCRFLISLVLYWAQCSLTSWAEGSCSWFRILECWSVSTIMLIREYRLLLYRLGSLLCVDSYHRSFRGDGEYCSRERQVRKLIVLVRFLTKHEQLPYRAFFCSSSFMTLRIHRCLFRTRSRFCLTIFAPGDLQLWLDLSWLVSKPFNIMHRSFLPIFPMPLTCSLIHGHSTP